MLVCNFISGIVAPCFPEPLVVAQHILFVDSTIPPDISSVVQFVTTRQEGSGHLDGRITSGSELGMLNPPCVSVVNSSFLM